MTARSKLPPKVVRFYGNVDFALDTIAHRQITLVHVSKLNDPFDPYFFFETDFGGNYDKLLEHVRKKHPQDVAGFSKAVTAESWGQSVDNVQRDFKALWNGIFVLSASAPRDSTHPKDNLYLWGHYGNGHRGVAIEFDTQQTTSIMINDHHRQKGDLLTAEDVWIRVDYEHRLAPITLEQFFQFCKNSYEQTGRRTSLHDYYDKIAKTKALAWKTENEWRLLWQNDETRLKFHRTAINEAAITAVYIGQNTATGAAEDIVFETRRQFPAAQIYKARKRHGEFALDFERL